MASISAGIPLVGRLDLSSVEKPEEQLQEARGNVRARVREMPSDQNALPTMPLDRVRTPRGTMTPVVPRVCAQLDKRVACDSSVSSNSTVGQELSARRLSDEAPDECPPLLAVTRPQLSACTSSSTPADLSTFLLRHEETIESAVSEDTLDVSSHAQSGMHNIAHQALCDARFEGATDRLRMCWCVWFGCILLTISGICSYFGVSSQTGGGTALAITYFTLAVLAALISSGLCLQIRAPLSLSITRASSGWCLILERRCLAPRMRRLEDLEAFAESFGHFSKTSITFVGQRAGFSTSKNGTVHLFFAGYECTPPLNMTISLEDPLAFFMKLRDIMAATGHGLATITENYVKDWDAATNFDHQQSSTTSNHQQSFHIVDKPCIAA